MNQPGDYEGFSANYSGAGFSGMRFRFHGLDDAGFDAWVAKARPDGERARPRTNTSSSRSRARSVPPRRFGSVDPDLYRRVLNRCVERGPHVHRRDDGDRCARRHRRDGALNTIPAEERQASAVGHAPFYVGELCTAADSIARYGPDSVDLLDLPAAVLGRAQHDL